MYMIGTEEYNNESIRINADLMICDKKKVLKYFFLKIASSCVLLKMGKRV